ncbi:kelch-like protein 40 [Drosophila elegans]|uniref:kelch-like protein 40 n=1 Tax=Drosophila elegans TaxID=30023 RepID=UPI0007E85A3F|nr:kelch-like protein 40 [Drosophila elegans]
MEKWLEPVFANLIENKKFCDCHILVQNESFECHKVILASASDFFERMFLSEFKESKSGKFHLSQVKPETFAMFLQYVYTYNKKKLEESTNSMIIELLSCGSIWLVKSIVADCVAILQARAPNMVIGDLVELFQHAHNLDHSGLIDISVQPLRRRFGTTMNCYDVLVLTSDVFEKYVIMSEGYLPEVERFKMIESYVTVNGLISDETVEDVDDDSKEGGDSGVGDMVKANPSSEDSYAESSESDDKPDTSTATCKRNDEKGAVGQMGSLRPNERNDGKMKNIRHKYIKTLLSYVKFNNMTKKDFYEVVGRSVLLSYKEKYESLFLTR